MEITINNYAQLLDFIKRDEVTNEQATEVVCKFLNVFCLNVSDKDKLIKLTENFINKFCKDDNAERPIFLDQLGDVFNIKDIYKKD